MSQIKRYAHRFWNTGHWGLCKSGKSQQLWALSQVNSKEHCTHPRLRLKQTDQSLAIPIRKLGNLTRAWTNQGKIQTNQIRLLRINSLSPSPKGPTSLCRNKGATCLRDGDNKVAGNVRTSQVRGWTGGCEEIGRHNSSSRATSKLDW
jgi:hypothetical protein